MEENMLAYLKELGTTQIEIDRVGEVLEGFRVLYLEPIDDIMVTDYVNEDGARILENLWFMSPSFLMEAKLFLSQDDYDITPYKNIVKYIDVKKENFDLRKASAKSRMKVFFLVGTHNNGELKGSQINCEYMCRFVEKYLIPNLEK